MSSSSPSIFWTFPQKVVHSKLPNNNCPTTVVHFTEQLVNLSTTFKLLFKTVKQEFPNSIFPKLAAINFQQH